MSSDLRELPGAGFPPCHALHGSIYSCRKTVFGSTCEARRAGMYAPNAAMIKRAIVTSATRGQ